MPIYQGTPVSVGFFETEDDYYKIQEWAAGASETEMSEESSPDVRQACSEEKEEGEDDGLGAGREGSAVTPSKQVQASTVQGVPKNALSESSKPTSMACRLQAASCQLKVRFFWTPCI